MFGPCKTIQISSCYYRQNILKFARSFQTGGHFNVKGILFTEVFEGFDLNTPYKTAAAVRQAVTNALPHLFFIDSLGTFSP